MLDEVETSKPPHRSAGREVPTCFEAIHAPRERGLDPVSATVRSSPVGERTELGLELSPMTWLSGVEDDVHFQFNATIGGYPEIAERMFWPLRVGIGLMTANTNGLVLFQPRLDLVGIAHQAGPVLIEVSLPSARFATDFDDAHVASWQFALSGTFIGRGKAGANRE